MPTISAVIPCYNAGPFIADALESVRRQTRPVNEIVVVDDCSTDDSAAVAQRFGVRYFRTGSNSGNAVARNIALTRATGEYVAWLDADDFWEDDHLERVAGLLDRFPEAAAAFGAVRLVGARSGISIPRLPESQPVDAFWGSFRHTVGQNMAAVARRDAQLAVGGFYEGQRAANDYDMWLRLSRKHRFVATHAVTANYRWHRNQISGRPDVQYRGVYQSRLRLVATVREEGDLELARRMEERMREIWAEDLENAWRSREMQALRYYLSFEPLVPGADPAVGARYAVKARLPRAAVRAWDLGPIGLLRKVRERIVGAGATPT